MAVNAPSETVPASGAWLANSEAWSRFPRSCSSTRTVELPRKYTGVVSKDKYERAILELLPRQDSGVR